MPAKRRIAPTEARLLEPAAIEAEHGLAYAHAFATAMAHRASLLTGDPG